MIAILARWPHGGFSISIAQTEESALAELSEFGDISKAEKHYLDDFMIDMKKIDSVVSMCDGFGGRTIDEIEQKAYNGMESFQKEMKRKLKPNGLNGINSNVRNKLFFKKWENGTFAVVFAKNPFHALMDLDEYGSTIEDKMEIIKAFAADFKFKKDQLGKDFDIYPEIVRLSPRTAETVNSLL